MRADFPRPGDTLDAEENVHVRRNKCVACDGDAWHERMFIVAHSVRELYLSLSLSLSMHFSFHRLLAIVHDCTAVYSSITLLFKAS